MRFLFSLVIIWAISCKKSGTNDSIIPLNDSILITSPTIYPLDLNSDGQNDIAIYGSRISWQTWQESLFFISKLNNQVLVHLDNGVQPICRDSVLLGAQMVPRIANCNGSGQQLHTDSFVYTPNLTRSQAGTTIVQELMTDTLLIYQSYANSPMPGPAASYYSWSHGFFTNHNSGYLLFSVNQVRYALKLRYSLPFLYFDEIHRLD